MKTKILPLLLLLIMGVSGSKAQQQSDSKKEQLLQLLDKEVSRSSQYVRMKEAEIQHLKNNLQFAVLTTDRYLSYKQIAYAYAKFNSDSATAYLHRCYELGQHTHNEVWMQDALIGEAFIYADRGDSYISATRLEPLGGIEKVMPSLRPAYAKAVLMQNIHYLSPGEAVPHYEDAVNLWNKYKQYLSKDDPSYYLYYINLFQNFKNPRIEARLKQLLHHTRPYSYNDALIRILLYYMYQQQGRNNEAFEFAVGSTIGDIQCANRSSSALLTVIQLLNKEGNKDDLLRLHNYIALCEEDVNQFRDVGRSIQLLQEEKKINEVYQAETHEQTVHLYVLIICIGFLLLLICYLMLKLRHKYNEHKNGYKNLLAEQHREVDNNKDLVKKIQDLELDNHELHEKTDGINTIIINSTRLISDILSNIRSYKKNMHNLLFTGMVREAKKLAGSSIAKDESVSRLYQHFDEFYLMIHPDFPDRFNALLEEDKRIIPEKEGTLAPELRIYALISLGIDDSVNIAEILLYSTQTVYNYRLKIRHSTKRPGFKIAEYVKEMYN